MAQYDNNMQGVLFKNDKKETDKHPDYKGSAEVNGEEFWISAWINTKANSSEKYLKLKFEAKQGHGGGGGRSSAPANRVADDDIPFHHEPDVFEFDVWHGHSNRDQ